MDALSQILDDFHLSRAQYVYLRTLGDWHLHCDPSGISVFYIVIMGRAWLRSSAQDKKSPHHPDEATLLSTGDMIMLPSGQPHQLYSAEHPERSLQTPAHELIDEFQGHRRDSIAIHEGRPNALILAVRCLLDADMARPLMSALPPLLHIQNTLQSAGPDWLQIGLQFLSLEAEKERPGRDTLINRLVSMLFIECIRDLVENQSDESTSWIKALKDNQLAPVLSALHASPEYPWTVNEMAALACQSRSAFADRFTQIMGVPPLNYLSTHRLRLAAWYLRQNELSVSRVSERVGYGSETAFSQAFKRLYNLSPSQYRKQQNSSQTG